MRRRLGWIACALIVAGAGAGLAGCGDTLQTPPVTDRSLLGATGERLFPVYWVGRAFEGMPVTGVSRDSGGAFTIDYGTCRHGGQYNCTPPLQVITAPDNSFLPGHPPDTAHERLRGRVATIASGGDTIELNTSNVVVDVFATSPGLARSAIVAMAPINMPGFPVVALPGLTSLSGYVTEPLQGPPLRYSPPSGTTDGGGAAESVIGSSL